MAETMARRVSRLVSGGFNAFVNAVEDASPATVMEESIREIDKAIDEVRTELGEAIAATHHTTNRLADETNKHTALGEKIELAVREGRDDLAETAIAQQLDIEAQIPVLEAAIEDGATRRTELEQYVAALKGKKREMEEELASFRNSRKTAAVSDSGEAAPSDVESKVERASDAFDRISSRATGLPAAARAGDRKSAADLVELDELARKSVIAERLAAIKGSG